MSDRANESSWVSLGVNGALCTIDWNLNSDYTTTRLYLIDLIKQTTLFLFDGLELRHSPRFFPPLIIFEVLAQL